MRDPMPAQPSAEDLEIRRKRLAFRADHRGMRETDLLFARFTGRHLARLDAAQLDQFEALLELPDLDVIDWLTRRAPIPPAYDHQVTRLLLDEPAVQPAPPSI